MENALHIRLVSGLVKARVDDTITTFAPYENATALRGDRLFFSLLAYVPFGVHGSIRTVVKVDSPLAEQITTYDVEHVPVLLPSYTDARLDDDYLDHRPALFPNVLRPTKKVFLYANQLHQLYFELRVPENAAPGSCPITVSLINEKDELMGEATLTVEILDALLPPQKLTCTEWFHCDCLATYYNVEVFSERHWEIIENFARVAVDTGINALLTPVLTPPLDTVVGSERPTVQLVDVTRENGKYTFGFDKLRRWCEMCQRVGVKELEINHLFTQWGAEHAPKVMATDNGEYRRIFGWETEAAGEEYVTFLRTLLPILKEKLDEFGYKDHYFFHISDEPNAKHLESYTKARNAVIDLIEDHPVRDALSDFEYYESGLVTHPIPSNDHIAPFLAAKVPDLWTYYCCVQGNKVSNRFIAMPGYRTRVLGAQLYKAEIAGFLQWGFNFYYGRRSEVTINPYLTADGLGSWPAGDPFAVYPDMDGKPLLALHHVMFVQALFDLRAMEAAEAVCGREAVLAAVESEGKIDFSHYPRSNDYLLTLRDRLNRMAAGV
ncbi:MAG: DUF4091 domain-containing protein [Ruminococcaceae bacterium]|nr:DUF4091 domain-containing protein [Oscillospiraceae bacterium]